MSPQAKCLLGVVLFTAGALTVSTISVITTLGSPPADAAAGKLALANPAIPVGSELFLNKFGSQSRPIGDKALPASSDGLVTIPGDHQFGIGSGDASLRIVDASSPGFAAPVFDLSDRRAGDSQEGDPVIRVGDASNAAGGGSGVAFDEHLRHPAAPGTNIFSLPGMGGGSGGGGPSLGPVQISATPITDRLPAPVPLPAAAVSGGAILAAGALVRALRRT